MSRTSNTQTAGKRRKQVLEQEEKLMARMNKVKHKIAVISGKGGVGKSTVTLNLAMAFALHDHANDIGILDADRVEYLIGYEGNAFAFAGRVEEDLLSITAVHPMRKEAVEEFLEKANTDWRVIEKLL